MDKVEPVERRRGPSMDRRSERAHRAVLEAAAALFEDVGYARLTIDAVAARARVSKATVYRWWPNKAAVLMEAFLVAIERDVAFPDSGSVRTDLVEQAASLAQVLGERRLGMMVVALLGEAQNDDDLAQAFRGGWQEPRRAAGREVLHRAVERGQLRADLDLELVLDGVYGPVYLRLLYRHLPLDRSEIEKLVDQILDGIIAPNHPQGDLPSGAKSRT